MATKKIKLPKDNQGNEYYPATTTDAVVHPVKRKSMTSIIDESEKKADEHGNAINEINETLPNKVDRTDNAPELTSGFAGNLVGRGEATSEEIGFRPSGGLTSVNDGAARIERLKGSTVVWNQWRNTVGTKTHNGVTIEQQSDGSISFVGESTGRANFEVARKSNASGHIFAIFGGKSNGFRSLLVYYNNETYISVSARETGKGIISAMPAGGNQAVLEIESAIEAGVSVNETTSPQLIDLTQMFGAGNEPTTIEEFNARKPLGIDEYAYNEGELISTTADEIKSVGFNILDVFTMQPGRISPNGDLLADTDVVHSDYIKVLPSSDYFTNIYCKQGVYAVLWFDESKAVISGALGSLVSNTGRSVTSPSNAAYVVINLPSTNYNSANFVFHLQHTGYRNGEYEPYEEFRRSLPISEIKDSEGNALFPNGLLSAGSVYDEITETKAIKRIGVVDLGSLEWQYESSTVRFKSDFSQFKVVPGSAVPNAVSSSYQAYTGIEFDSSKTLSNIFRLDNVLPRIYVRNLSYTDPAAFKTAMQGVMLYYELAEPIEVDLEEPINMDYEVSDFGTEEVISDTPTTPLKADIIYQFNAVDRIRENSANIKKIEDKLDDISVDLLTPITYSSLKALRDGGSLVKGMWYRITDYVTTTKQSNTKSANHPFDVIVLATSESELSHLAKAIAHEGDTYFNGNDLGAWELWYDLDNDGTKYAWADATNGKGVIYRMIDEKRNDCPYDFKNILFYNDKYTKNTTSDKYYYTFSYLVKNVLYDGTVEKQVTDCYRNSMEVYISNEKKSLNGNVWRNLSFAHLCFSNTFENSCYSNTFENECYCNTFKYNCYSNTFGEICNYNTFGFDCSDNIFGRYCSENTFGCDFSNNTFGEGCKLNTFGNHCLFNTFGNGCTSNTFGNNCSHTFGNTCHSNTFGNGCYNTFGDGCSNNTFGNDCNYNTLGNDCIFNIFESGCFGNKLGVLCQHNAFGNGCYCCGFYNSSEFVYNEDVDEYLGAGTPVEEVRDCRFGEGCSHLLINTNDYVRNLFVSQGLYSLIENEEGYTLPEVIKVDSYGDYELKIARNRNGEIKVYCEAEIDQQLGDINSILESIINK